MKARRGFWNTPFALTAGTLLTAAVLPSVVREGAPASGATEKAATTDVIACRLRDATGKGWTLGELHASKALVDVFIGVQCPVSNSYAEYLSQLQDRYRDRGARFVAVDANPDESLSDLARYGAQYHCTFPLLRDDHQNLANSLHAKVTPDAFVLDPSGAVRYHGRIDDGFASRTQKRSNTTTHELETALEAVVSNQPVKVAAMPAVGCSIPRAKPAVARAGFTYYQDVAPILQE